MTRYYMELIDGRIDEVVAQDETGVWIGVVFDSPDGPTLKVRQYMEAEETIAKLPEWKQPRRVLTTSVDYLDFLRRCERGAYVESVPTEIRERLGSAEEVIRRALKKSWLSREAAGVDPGSSQFPPIGGAWRAVVSETDRCKPVVICLDCV